MLFARNSLIASQHKSAIPLMGSTNTMSSIFTSDIFHQLTDFRVNFLWMLSSLLLLASSLLLIPLLLLVSLLMLLVRDVPGMSVVNALPVVVDISFVLGGSTLMPLLLTTSVL